MQRAISYIRFSSGKQAKGTSVERQLVKARKYCAENDLLLDETFSMTDAGFSAFSGSHLESGALGRFQESCERGDIPSGTALVVEAIDRLSRLPSWETIDLLSGIIKCGIAIHVIDAGMVLDRKHRARSSLQVVSVLAERAYDESLGKSEDKIDSFDAHIRAYERGEKVILHGTVPLWCKVVKDEFGEVVVPIPERAAIVKRIFEMAAGGFRCSEIARTLNSENIMAWGKKRKHWISFAIREMLQSDTPMGILAPRARSNRQKRDYRFENYYPQVVSPELASDARAVLKLNRKGSSGRTASGLLPVNFLRGKLRHSNHNVRFVNHRNGHKDENGVARINSYFEVHDESGSTRRLIWRMPAAQVETLVFAAISELTADDLTPPPDNSGVRAVAVAEENCRKLQKSIDRLLDALASSDLESPAIASRIRETEVKLASEKKRLEAVSSAENERLAVLRSVASTLDELRDLALDGDNNVRERIGAVVNRLVARIYVGTPGIEFLDGAAAQINNAQQIVEEIDGNLNIRRVADPIRHSKRRKSCSVIIFFATGVIREVIRIGADWESLPADYPHRRTGPNFETGIFILGSRGNGRPEFAPELEKMAITRNREPIEVPEFIEKLHEELMEEFRGSEST